MQGILPVILPRSNRKAPEHPDYRRYRDRNRIERMFGKLKQQRRIATRYDKTVLSFASFLNLAAIRLCAICLWLKSFVNNGLCISLYSGNVLMPAWKTSKPQRLLGYLHCLGRD